MIGLEEGFIKLLTIWTGLCYDFYFSHFDLDDKSAFCDWHYLSYLISAKEALGLTLVVIWEYLEVWVPLLKPEFVAFVRLAELKPKFVEMSTFFRDFFLLFGGDFFYLDFFRLCMEWSFNGKGFILLSLVSQFHWTGIKNKFNCISAFIQY